MLEARRPLGDARRQRAGEPARRCRGPTPARRAPARLPPPGRARAPARGSAASAPGTAPPRPPARPAAPRGASSTKPRRPAPSAATRASSAYASTGGTGATSPTAATRSPSTVAAASAASPPADQPRRITRSTPSASARTARSCPRLWSVAPGSGSLSPVPGRSIASSRTPAAAGAVVGRPGERASRACRGGTRPARRPDRRRRRRPGCGRRAARSCGARPRAQRRTRDYPHRHSPTTCEEDPVQLFPSDKIRNVALVGHGGAGKTTLAEALLHRAGAINRLGRVEDGTTVCDHDPEEQQRGQSLGPRGGALRVEGPQGQPGRHARLRRLPRRRPGRAAGRRPRRVRGQRGRGRRGADGGGVEGGRLASACRAWSSSTSSTGSGPASSGPSTSSRDRLGAGVAPLELPIGSEASFRGIADLLTDTAHVYERRRAAHRAHPRRHGGARAPGARQPRGGHRRGRRRPARPLPRRGRAEPRRARARPDARHRDGERLPRRVRLGHRRDRHRPPGRPPRARSAPRPPTDPVVVAAGDTEVEVAADPDGQPLAVVFKVIADPFVGQVSLLKVLSGTIRNDDHLVNSRTGTDERLHGLFVVRGKEHEPVDGAGGGRHRRRGQAGEHGHQRHARAQGPTGPCARHRPAGARALHRRGAAVQGRRHEAGHRPAPPGGGGPRARRRAPRRHRPDGARRHRGDAPGDRRRAPAPQVRRAGRHRAGAGRLPGDDHRSGHGVHLHAQEAVGRPRPVRPGDAVRRAAGAGSRLRVREPHRGRCHQQGLRAGRRARAPGGDGAGRGRRPPDRRPAHHPHRRQGALGRQLGDGLPARRRHGAPRADRPRARPSSSSRSARWRSPSPPTSSATCSATCTRRRGRVQGTEPADAGEQVVFALVPESELRTYATDLRSLTGGRGRFTSRHDHYDVLAGAAPPPG